MLTASMAIIKRNTGSSPHILPFIVLILIFQIKIFEYLFYYPDYHYNRKNPRTDTAGDGPQRRMVHGDVQTAHAKSRDCPENDQDDQSNDAGAGFFSDLPVLFF